MACQNGIFEYLLAFSFVHQPRSIKSELAVMLNANII